MAWSTEFQHILQAHVDEWKDTKGNVEERKTLIKKLMVDIKTHHEQSNNEGILPVDLAKVRNNPHQVQSTNQQCRK
jgi:hypothetical protein